MDLDGDGDLDILTGDYYGDFHYFENSGTPSLPIFEEPIQNPFGLTNVMTNFKAIPTLGDIDNDGDLDLILGKYNSYLYYFENEAR